MGEVWRHNPDACPFCAAPAIRAAVLAGPGRSGWQCAKCGWATTDLGTMHEQLWDAGFFGEGGRVIDMVCPGCGAEGEFVDYEET